MLGPPTSKRWSYAVSKLYDEHLALALAEERGLKRRRSLRLFNAYGPRNHLSWWGGPLVTFIEALLDGEQMEIHGDGHQTRTFTYVSDTVDGFVRALRTPKARGEVINVGGTQTISILELAEKGAGATWRSRGPLRAKFIPYETSPATTRTSAIACPTRRRRRSSSASRRRSGSTRVCEDGRVAPRAARRRARRGPA